MKAIQQYLHVVKQTSISKNDLHFHSPLHLSAEFETHRYPRATWESQWILLQWPPRFVSSAETTFECHRLPATT